MKNYLQRYKSLPMQMKASLWFLICSFMQKGISTITTPIFTRILSTDEYGEFSVFNSWMQIITPIVCLNLYSGVYSQGLVKFEEDRNRFSSSLQGLVLTLIIVWTAIYLIAVDFWNHLFSLTTPEMLAMMLMIWASAAFSFWSMNQRVDFKYQKLIIFTLAASILQPTFSIIFMFHSNNKVMARILGIVVVQLALYAWMFVDMMAKGKMFYSKQYWAYALRFNIPLLPHYLSMNVLSSSDRIMIRKMVGTSEAGIYNLAYSLSLIMTMFNSALLQTIEPWIYRKLKENKASEIAQVAYPCFFLVAGLNILLIMFAPEAIAIFAPVSYQEAIWMIPSVALSVFFMFLYTFFATFEFYYEKTQYIAGASVGGAVLNVTLNYICIRKFGYIAAGYVTLFSYILFAILHYHFMQKICKEFLNDLHPYDRKIIFGIAVGSLVLGFSIMATYHNTLIRYTLILLLMVVLICMRKRIMKFATMLLDIRNKK
jgi:O-antigen/teichoic acid export membrane protein